MNARDYDHTVRPLTAAAHTLRDCRKMRWHLLCYRIYQLAESFVITESYVQ